MKTVFHIFLMSIATLLFSCGKELSREHTDKSAPAPPQVTNVQVIPTTGGALITYSIPANVNFSYAKAVYERLPGVTAENKTSIYNDTLKVEGFGSVSQREVKIYSVGKNGNESDPVIVKVNPLPPAVKTVFPTLVLNETFGGAYVRFKNPDKANLAIVLMYDSTGNGTWAEARTYYTAADSGIFSARGFDADPTKFAVYIRDRWNNRSDTLSKTLTPVFEQQIPKTTWAAYNLPTDTYIPVEPYYPLQKLWDGKPDWDLFATPHDSKLPQWFTFDMGKKAILSRMKQWQFPAAPYSGSSMKVFEVWGSNAPAADGSWNGWEKLGAFQSFIPSGNATPTADDNDYVLNRGEEFEFPIGLPAVRYIRIKAIASWAKTGPTGQIVIAELSFWGQITQ